MEKALARLHFLQQHLAGLEGLWSSLCPVSPPSPGLWGSTQSTGLPTQACRQDPHTRTPGFVLLPFPKSSFLTTCILQELRNTLPSTWGCSLLTHAEWLWWMGWQSSDSQSLTGGIRPTSTLCAAPGAELQHRHTEATSPERGAASCVPGQPILPQLGCCRKSPQTLPWAPSHARQHCRHPLCQHTPAARGKAPPPGPSEHSL